MRATLIATMQSGTRVLCLRPRDCTWHSLGTSIGLAKAVDYAELFIYDEAQQEAALSDIAILEPCPASVSPSALVVPDKPQEALGRGALPRRCEQCLMSLPLVFALRACHICRRNCLTLCRCSSLMTFRLGLCLSLLRQAPPWGGRAAQWWSPLRP